MENILIKLKIIILFIFLFIYMCFYITLPKMISTIIFNNWFEWFIHLMNLKINIHGNIEPDENVIYVSNHVGGFDFFVLKYLLSKYRRNLYTVVYDNMVDIKGYIKFCLYNIKIRPITLKYNKILLNQNRSKNFSLEEWFNLTVDVYIHEIQQNSNWEILMKDCYELISKI